MPLSISGSVRVEYAFETARVRLYLPSNGETWFFIDQKTTMEEFVQACEKEDTKIVSGAVRFLDKDMKEIKG